MAPPSRIREYMAAVIPDGTWVTRSEIPTSSELLGSAPVCAPNKPDGAWSSTDEYLRTHYELLRENSLKDFRNAIAYLRTHPHATEEHSSLKRKLGIYDKTHVIGVVASHQGAAVRVSFGGPRSYTEVDWTTSDRLTAGRLVILTPAGNPMNGAEKIIVATVAARPLSGVTQIRPEVDLFWAQSDELNVDPNLEWLMVESQTGYWEAARHTLKGLQKMVKEPFPLHEHLVYAQKDVPPPQYVKDSPHFDLTPLLKENTNHAYDYVDVLQSWPDELDSKLDTSQLGAVRSMLSSSVALVQGPPGTGKSYTSVQAIRIMLAKQQSWSPPIIIACQTNHAVDQLLRHISEFEPDFVRIGGRSEDEMIKKRTLFEVREEYWQENPRRGGTGGTRKLLKGVTKKLGRVLTPLHPDTAHGLELHVLVEYGIITKVQAESLECGAKNWVQDDQSDSPDVTANVLTRWVGDAPIPVSFNEMLDNSTRKADDPQTGAMGPPRVHVPHEPGSLAGEFFPLAKKWTRRPVPGVTSTNVSRYLTMKDLWQIPETSRGAVYYVFQEQLKDKLRKALVNAVKSYNAQARKCTIARVEEDVTILRDARIIGLTTTGFSKNRALLRALGPKCVLIEEAGEVLEAPVAVTCLPSVEQLILVGDHKQLQPHVELASDLFLHVSLLEREINNKLPLDTLCKQRRMRPEIRRLLYPIYRDILKDHEDMTRLDLRPDVPGMGGINSFFFSHQWPEKKDEFNSSFNPREACMVAGFVEYLVHNDVSPSKITVLTFYHGQRKEILKELSRRSSLEKQSFAVETVDSYQGEENDIVCLSLARSNADGSIGFLAVMNRVCVALSRARRGLYIFGDGDMLHATSGIWRKVINILFGVSNKQERPKKQPKRVGKALEVVCSNHHQKTEIWEPEDWDKIDGGCTLMCGATLSCGHTCPLRCHPLGHEEKCLDCNSDTASPDLAAYAGSQPLAGPSNARVTSGTTPSGSNPSHGAVVGPSVPSQNSSVQVVGNDEEEDLIDLSDTTVSL